VVVTDIERADDDTLISKKKLAELSGGRSHMWPGRVAARDPSFPQVRYVGKDPYYRLGDWRVWWASLPTVPPSSSIEAGERIAEAANARWAKKRKAAAAPGVTERKPRPARAARQIEPAGDR
jgi:hypothetical protein